MSNDRRKFLKGGAGAATGAAIAGFPMIARAQQTFTWKMTRDDKAEYGPNSESGRRAAGEGLHGLLKSYDAAGRDYYLLGHSHGGSVIYNALLHSVAKDAPLQRLKAWCTVGTPFLDYQPNRRLYSRLSTTGLTLYSTAIGALLFALHPVQTEAVTYVSGRSVSLMALFYLGAVLAWLDADRTPNPRAWRGLSAGLFGASLLVKETAVTLPLALLLLCTVLALALRELPVAQQPPERGGERLG